MAFPQVNSLKKMLKMTKAQISLIGKITFDWLTATDNSRQNDNKNDNYDYEYDRKSSHNSDNTG